MITQRLIVVTLIILLVITPTTQSKTTREEVSGWTWSEEIIPGLYTWNVTEFSVLSQPVTDKRETGDLILGSIIQLNVQEKLFGIDYINRGNDFKLPIEVKIDGLVVDKGALYPVEFIYPSLVIWSNNTYDNVFLLDTPEFQDVLDFSNHSSIEGDFYIIDDQEGDRKLITKREISTGILYSYRVEIFSSIIEYTFIGFIEITIEKETSLKISDGFRLGLIFCIAIYYSSKKQRLLQ